jgi:hypothetical protein
MDEDNIEKLVDLEMKERQLTPGKKTKEILINELYPLIMAANFGVAVLCLQSYDSKDIGKGLVIGSFGYTICKHLSDSSSRKSYLSSQGLHEYKVRDCLTTLEKPFQKTVKTTLGYTLGFMALGYFSKIIGVNINEFQTATMGTLTAGAIMLDKISTGRNLINKLEKETANFEKINPETD